VLYEAVIGFLTETFLSMEPLIDYAFLCIKVYNL
jgi:hypothetical protein